MTEEELIVEIDRKMQEEVELVRMVGQETVKAIRKARMLTPSQESAQILDTVRQCYANNVETLSANYETLVALNWRN